MTCEEFQAGLKTNLEDTTRAFRALMGKHVRECRDCANVILKRVSSMSPERVSDAYGYAVPVLKEDSQDPEFREIAYGSKE